MTKNADNDKYKYSGYELGFNRYGLYSHPSGGIGRNVIIFEVDISSSTTIDNEDYTRIRTHTECRKNVFN